MTTPHNRLDRFSRLAGHDLKKEATRFIDVKSLFPKSKVDLRTNPSKYQEKIIRRALREVEKIADGAGIMERDFVPVKNAKRYMKDEGLPRYLKGVFMTGGDRDNKKAVYRDGKILYQRGDADREFTSLNNWSERILRKELLEAAAPYDTRQGALHLTANGRVMIKTETHDKKALEINAIYVFNKYKDMAARGEKRSNGNKAAHPKKWGIGLLWEKKLYTKKTAAVAWRELTQAQRDGWTEGAKYFNSTKFEAFEMVYNSQH